MASNTHSIDWEAGSSQYSSIADGSQTGLDLAGDFTIEGWYKIESLPAATYYLASKGDLADDRSYSLYLSNDAGTYYIFAEVDQVGDASVRDVFKWEWSVSAATWYHLALTFDISAAAATEFELYIDTASQGNGTQVVGDNVSSINNSDDPFYFATAANSGTPEGFADGLFNNWRVWSDIRTSEEITANWKQILSSGTNLVSSWYADDNHNDLVTGTGNNLTASGSPVFSTDVPFSLFTPQVISII